MNGRSMGKETLVSNRFEAEPHECLAHDLRHGSLFQCFSSRGKWTTSGTCLNLRAPAIQYISGCAVLQTH
jgi:hypothetical protein